MKKILLRICGAILFCAVAAGSASCQKDTPQVVNPADIELSDYEWDIDFPYEVYLSPGVAAELKEAYGDFIAAPAGTISENTYMVILDKLGDLPEEQLVELYDKGVILAVAHPERAEFKAIFERNPEMGYFLDNESIDGALLLAISGWNNGYYIIPDEKQFLERYRFETDHPVVPSPAEAGTGDFDPDEAPVYTDEEALEYDLSYYFFGAFLEDLLEQQAIYDGLSTETKTGDKTVANVKQVAGRSHVCASGVFKIDQVYFRSSYRFNAVTPVTVSYDVYPIHVYEGENGAGDYYFVDMTANVPNDQMFKGKNAFTTGGFPVYLRWCGAYPKTFKVSTTLINSDNTSTVSGVSFPADGFPIPETVVKTTNYSKSKTFNIGTGVTGNIGGEKGQEQGGNQNTTSSGIKGGGSVSVNAGWSWTDTKSWTEKDIDVENRTAGNSAGWALAYNALPEFKWSEQYGFDLGNSRAYRSSTQLRGSWVWHVPGMADDTETQPLRIKVEVEGNYGFMKFITTKADLDTYSWTCSFTDIQTMPKMVRFRAGNLILKNNFAGKYISNVMVYNAEGKPLVPATNFQNSYPAGTDIKLGAYNCKEDLMVKFKMDGKTYKYSLNPYVKTVFKNDVILYADNDFSVEE